jgi:hypothetical protein
MNNNITMFLRDYKTAESIGPAKHQSTWVGPTVPREKEKIRVLGKGDFFQVEEVCWAGPYQVTLYVSRID